jgi:hypothetical protein
MNEQRLMMSNLNIPLIKNEHKWYCITQVYRYCMHSFIFKLLVYNLSKNCSVASIFLHHQEHSRIGKIDKNP